MWFPFSLLYMLPTLSNPAREHFCHFHWYWLCSQTTDHQYRLSYVTISTWLLPHALRELLQILRTLHGALFVLHNSFVFEGLEVHCPARLVDFWGSLRAACRKLLVQTFLCLGNLLQRFRWRSIRSVLFGILCRSTRLNFGKLHILYKDLVGRPLLCLDRFSDVVYNRMHS